MEITVEITQFCPYSCNYCSSNAGQEGKHLNFKTIQTFINTFTEIDRINVSGGEPLSHPDFWKILCLCYEKTENVWVYTNMIKGIKYNSDIINDIKIEANVCLCPGKRIYIPDTSHTVNLLPFVSQGRGKNIRPVKLYIARSLTGGCDFCNHYLLQSDGKVVSSPCKKEY